MSLNVKLSAPHLPKLGTSKPEDPEPEKPRSDAPKADDNRTRDVYYDIPTAEEEAITTTIHFTDGVKEREAFYLKLLKSSLDDETLSDLRSNIAGLTGSIEISHFPFCGKKGAVVPDSFTVEDYLTECLGIDTAAATTLDIYMKDGSTSQELNAKAISGDVIEAEKVAAMKSQIDDTAFKWITGTQAKYVPELEQRDWAAISDSNALCYGIRIIRVKDPDSKTKTKDPRGIPVGIERARCPAFRLKKRTIWSDNIPTSTIDGVKLDLRIPDHIIDDKSYVSIYETETEMQTSMATSSFSETDVAASGSASFMGFSGSASMSLAVASSQAATNSSSKKSKKVTIAYSFPRVTVFLDSRSLILTQECTEALYNIKNKDDVHDFQDIYGEFFSTRVQLGGRLFSTEDITGSSEESTNEKIKSMKIAAAASFSGCGVSVDVSASHGKGSEPKEMKASSEMVSTLTWHANGGDTFLCNQPQEWAPTVAYHWNWRVTKQDHVASIFEVISQVKGMKWIIPETVPLGVTINPNFDDAVAKPPETSTFTARTFTLNAATHKDGGRPLHTFPASHVSLGNVAQVCNAAKVSSFRIDSDLQSRGSVVLGPERNQTSGEFKLYEAENEDGVVQDQLKYNTKYRLRNKERGLYVDYHWTQGFKFLTSNASRSSTYFLVFKKPDGSSDTNVIPNKATVSMVFYADGNSPLGYVYTCAKDQRNAYLFCSQPDDNKGNETKMTLTYV